MPYLRTAIGGFQNKEFCVNGQFKRELRSIGFFVTNPKGPFVKREMTLAFKDQ
jgi:tRNA U34 5-methylaminomethyl-2-thiouridine-forming methyltransferase MnmC